MTEPAARDLSAEVIAGLVLAVRVGDACAVEDLLRQFCGLAEFADLLVFRAALEDDLVPAAPGGLSLGWWQAADR